MKLFQYNANLKQTDHEGRTCLTYAKAANELAKVKQSNNKSHHVSSGMYTSVINSNSKLIEHFIFLINFYRNYNCSC